MNLINGQLTDAKQSKIVLDALGERILATLQRGSLEPATVIEACHRLIEKMDDEAYLSKMLSLGIDRLTGESYLTQVKIMFSRDYLKERLQKELGENYHKEYSYIPFSGDSMVGERIMPLGVLLHIAAGNADALPAFSVFEGLLTGNINILKLPEVDAGISIDLLMELIKNRTTACRIYICF